MDLGLEGKVALVTAASKGLGRAIATELAREGARVVISSRAEKALSKTAGEIGEETGAEVDYRAADLTSAGDIEALVSHAVDRFGGGGAALASLAPAVVCSVDRHASGRTPWVACRARSPS